MTQRIVVTGSESTGKTTLARALAAHLGAPLVIEAAREYAERVQRVLTLDDVEPIARRTIILDDAAAATKPPLIVLDTDLVSTVVYSREYFRACPKWVVAAARKRRGDLYLLCDIDLPWQADGVRDLPDGRAAMHERFLAALKEFGCTFARVSGAGEARLQRAIATVEHYRAAPRTPSHGLVQ